MDNSDNAILKLTFDFAIEAVKYSELLELKGKTVVAKRFLDSATSIGAIAREAQSAENKMDFLHFIKISEKRARETEYWLDICKNSENYPDCEKAFEKFQVVKQEIDKIIGKSKRSSIGFQSK